VEDPELPFPESVAAGEVHKAGQGTAKTAKYLFYNIGFGAATFQDLAARFQASDGGVLIPVDANDDLLVRGVTAAQLSATDFILV